MSSYKAVVLNKRPKDDIVPGETFKLESRSVPTEADLKDGQVLFQSLYLSLDPAMRGWLNGELMVDVRGLSRLASPSLRACIIRHPDLG